MAPATGQNGPGQRGTPGSADRLEPGTGPSVLEGSAARSRRAKVTEVPWGGERLPAPSVTSPVPRRRERVLAAGTVVWRQVGEELEVLLVHRPRHQDWSFPKGKLDKGEPLCACAARETAEETGLRTVLGQSLGIIRYQLVDGREKEVHYWAAQAVPSDHPSWRVRNGFKVASLKEIDCVAWVGASQARKQLTHPLDRELLGQLVGLWESARLATQALVLLRHACAVGRAAWNRPENGSVKEQEATRPLTPWGQECARLIVPVLAAYGGAQVVTSPWRRCLDTVAPYLESVGLDAVPDPRLTEEAHAQDPEAVRALLEGLMTGLFPESGAGAAAGTTVVCLHRPSLPTVMSVVAEHALEDLREEVPDVDPWLEAGEVLVLHLARTVGGGLQVVSMERPLPHLSRDRDIWLGGFRG